MQSYLAPPITAVFLLGLFWKRINSKGANAALIGGFVIGMLRLAAELGKEHLGGILYRFADINFLYFCFYLFLLSIGIMVTVSLITSVPSPEKIRGLTYATTVSGDKQASRATWGWKEVALSLVVLAVIAAVMIYFSPLMLAK